MLYNRASDRALSVLAWDIELYITRPFSYVSICHLQILASILCIENLQNCVSFSTRHPKCLFNQHCLVSSSSIHTAFPYLGRYATRELRDIVELLHTIIRYMMPALDINYGQKSRIIEFFGLPAAHRISFDLKVSLTRIGYKTLCHSDVGNVMSTYSRRNMRHMPAI